MPNEIQPQPEEIRIIDGKRYRKVPSGYTIKQYYSHETPEKGPGPGWDNHLSVCEEYGVIYPKDLPDEPYYVWEEIKEVEKKQS